MPRINQGVAMAEEYNLLVPRARELGLNLQVINPSSHFNRSLLRQRLAELRRQVSGLGSPVLAIGEQTFGVEFEFLLPPSRAISAYALADALNQVGIETTCENYSHQTRSTWKIITDGSLGYSRGRELVSPVLSGNAGIEAVRKAARVLREKGCKISRRCGFHVHVGARDHGIQFFKNVLRTYAKFEPVLDRVMAPSRRHNHYCAPVRFNEERLEQATTMEELRREPNLASRFHKLNLQSYWRHGTVEFRQHQGTVEGDRAAMWVRVALRITAAAATKSKEELAAAEVSLAGFLKLVEAELVEAEYLLGRDAFFAGRN
jgi:hypothetical protein